jgi:CRP/FNR family transcriptional regulator
MKTIQHCSNICDQCDLPEACFASVHGGTIAPSKKIVQKSILIKKNEALYRQGEKFRGIFIVKKGGLKACILNKSGQEIIIAFYLPGALLGFSSLSSEIYMEDTKAFEDSELCQITLSDFIHFLQQDPSFQKALVMSLSDDLKKAHIDQYTRAYPSAKEKVARFILEYLKRWIRQGEVKDGFYFLPTQQDMAAFLGLTPETVSRVLSQFQKEKIMISGLKRKHFSVDHTRLEALISR